MQAGSRVVRVGLVGCGRVARVHAEALAAAEQTQLVAVADVKEDRAQTFAEKYGAEAYTDWTKMLERDDIDAIQICTPHYLHAEMTIAAANAGKHVLTEKPMAISVEQADAMIEAAKRNNVTLGVIFQNRYNDASVAIKEAIDSGRLGEIKGARAFITWNRSDDYYKQSDWKGTWDKEGGGVLIDQAIHTIDLMQWFVGEVDSIRATYETRAHDFIDVDDVAEAFIKFKNGAIACLYANCFYVYDAPIYLEIVGTEGRVELIGSEATIHVGNERLIVKQAADKIVGKDYWGSSHKRQIIDFYSNILNGERPFIDGEAGKVAMEMVLAMYESARTGRTVHFPYVPADPTSRF